MLSSHDSDSNCQSTCATFDLAVLAIQFLLCSSSGLKTLLTQFTSHASVWLSTHAQTSMKYILQVACAVMGMHSTVRVDLLNGHVPDPCRKGWCHTGPNHWKVKGQKDAVNSHTSWELLLTYSQWSTTLQNMSWVEGSKVNQHSQWSHCQSKFDPWHTLWWESVEVTFPSLTNTIDDDVHCGRHQFEYR